MNTFDAKWYEFGNREVSVKKKTFTEIFSQGVYRVGLFQHTEVTCFPCNFYMSEGGKQWLVSNGKKFFEVSSCHWQCRLIEPPSTERYAVGVVEVGAVRVLPP